MSHRVVEGVMVEWTDAASEDGWMSYEEAMKNKPCHVISLGWLLAGGKKNEDIRLCAGVGDDEVMQVLTIPAQWVKVITKLGVTASIKLEGDSK